VTERAIIVGAALLLVGLALLQMATMHDRHYRNRRWQLLEARLAAIERILVGEHE
jgi:hypothetical protein